MKKEDKILDDVMIVCPHVKIWAGRKKFKLEEHLDPNDVPPTELANASIKACDSKRLSPLNKIRNAVNAKLDLYGVKALKGGSFIIPRAKWGEVVGILKNHQTEFNDAVDVFLKEHDDANRKWKEKFPGWENIVDKILIPAEVLKSRFGFGWVAFAANHAGGEVDAAESGLDEMVGNLGNSLFQEIATDARKAFESWNGSKEQCSKRSFGPLQRYRAKLDNLQLLHPSAAVIRDLLDDVLAKLPINGPYVGSDFMMLKGVVEMVQDTKAMEVYGKQVLKTQMTSDSFLDDWASRAFASSAPVVDVAEEGPSEVDATESDESEAPLFEAGVDVDALFGDSSENSTNKEEADPLPAKEPELIDLPMF